MLDHHAPLFAPATVAAIQAHAIACYPNEACGVVTVDGFVPLDNVSPEPHLAFDCADACSEYQIDGTLLAVVHSHIAGQHQYVTPNFPSAADMRSQVDFDLPWGLCATEGRSCTTPWFWGGDLPRPPLVGRRFRHGPSGTDGKGDCYALIRDFYLYEYDIELPEFPRDWEWWGSDNPAENDLYEQGFAQAGFRDVPRTQVRRGDVGLVKHPQQDSQGRASLPRVVHGCVAMGNGMVLDHKFGKVSAESHLGDWNHLVHRWVRHHSMM